MIKNIKNKQAQKTNRIIKMKLKKINLNKKLRISIRQKIKTNIEYFILLFKKRISF